MILYPEKILPYFEKNKEYYDFIFSFLEYEVSEKIFSPVEIRSKLVEIKNLLELKENFPLGKYYYFEFEDLKSNSFLYVTLKGSELNKIVENKIYNESILYDVNTNFDEHNQATLLRSNPTVSIKDENGQRTKSLLDFNAFPSTIHIEKVDRSHGFEKQSSKVNFVIKEPIEHFKEELDRLIKVCDICIDHSLGIKSYVDC